MSSGGKFALVSTVDTWGPEFLEYGVYLYHSKRDALLFAVGKIVEHDERVAYVESEALWTFGDEHFDDPEDLLEAWQQGLDATEYFHVMPVVELDDVSR